MFPPSTASTSLQACATSIDVHATIMRLLVGIMTKPSRISLFMSKIYYKCQIRTGKSAFPRFAWLDSDSAVLCNGPLKQVGECRKGYNYKDRKKIEGLEVVGMGGLTKDESLKNHGVFTNINLKGGRGPATNSLNNIW